MTCRTTFLACWVAMGGQFVRGYFRSPSALINLAMTVILVLYRFVDVAVETAGERRGFCVLRYNILDLL